MPAIVAKILFWLGRSPIGQALFTLIIEKLSRFLRDSIAREKQRRKVIADAAASMQSLKDAKTKEEIEAASSSSIDGL